MNTEPETVTSHRTVFVHLHVVGKGTLPKLVERALRELITENGRATEALLSLCKQGLVLHRDKEENLIAAELTVPCRRDKYSEINLKAGKPVLETREKEVRKKGELVKTLVTKKWYGEGNSYHIIRFTPGTGMFTVRVFEKYAFDTQRLLLKSDVVFSSELPKGIKVVRDTLPANFLQAVFTSFLELPFRGFSEIVVKPALKQAAEQLLSYIQLEAGETQEAEYPGTLEREPSLRLLDWQKAREKLESRVELFEFSRAREVDRYGKNDPRGDRMVNVSPDWTRFVRSPFPARLPLKIPPEFCTLFRRKTEGRAKIPERLYLGLRMFDGAPQGSELQHIAEAEKGKLFWWHKHLNEFSLLPGFADPKLGKKPLLLVVPLEYDREGGFEESIGDGRKICLVTLKETRNFRKGRHGHSRTDRLDVGDSLWRADFATSAEVVVPEWSGKILGIHFRDDPVITWALLGRDGTVLEEGQLEGNPFLDKALSAQECNQVSQKAGKWVGDRSFADKLKGITHTVARAVVRLAVAKDAWIALEDVSWVDKQSGDSKANRRFSMWNFSRLATLIEWLGMDITTREAGSPAPLAGKVSDYLTRFTCPSCGACRKAGQKKEVADTLRVGEILECRKCGFSGEIPNNFIARFVANRVREQMLKRTA